MMIMRWKLFPLSKISQDDHENNHDDHDQNAVCCMLVVSKSVVPCCNPQIFAATIFRLSLASLQFARFLNFQKSSFQDKPSCQNPFRLVWICKVVRRWFLKQFHLVLIRNKIFKHFQIPRMDSYGNWKKKVMEIGAVNSEMRLWWARDQILQCSVTIWRTIICLCFSIWFCSYFFSVSISVNLSICVHLYRRNSTLVCAGSKFAKLSTFTTILRTRRISDHCEVRICLYFSILFIFKF